MEGKHSAVLAIVGTKFLVFEPDMIITIPTDVNQMMMIMMVMIITIIMSTDTKHIKHKHVQTACN